MGFVEASKPLLFSHICVKKLVHISAENISYGMEVKLRILAVHDSERMLKSNCLHFFTHTKQMFGSLRIQGSKTCCLRLHLLSFSLTYAQVSIWVILSFIFNKKKRKIPSIYLLQIYCKSSIIIIEKFKMKCH